MWIFSVSARLPPHPPQLWISLFRFSSDPILFYVLDPISDPISIRYLNLNSEMDQEEGGWDPPPLGMEKIHTLAFYDGRIV